MYGIIEAILLIIAIICIIVYAHTDIDLFFIIGLVAIVAILIVVGLECLDGY